MGGFVFRGAVHAQCPVKSSLVVPVDPAGSRVLDVSDGAVAPGVEHRGTDALGLVQAGHALHQCIVVRVADRPDRGTDPFELEAFGEPDGGVRTRPTAPAVVA